MDKATRRWRTAYVIEDLRKLNVTIVKEHGIERYYMIHEKDKIVIEKESYARYGGLAIVKEYVPSQGWRTLAKRGTSCNFRQDPCLDIIQDFVNKLEMRTYCKLSNSMRIHNYLPSVEWLTGNSHYGVAYLPSAFVKNRGLKVKVDTGDSEHANAPLIYVNKDSGKEKVIYEADEDCYSFSQIGFAEHDGFLLVGTEYGCRCSRVIDMRTGETILDLPSKSPAVWVEVPRGFGAAASGS